MNANSQDIRDLTAELLDKCKQRGMSNMEVVKLSVYLKDEICRRIGNQSFSPDFDCLSK